MGVQAGHVISVNHTITVALSQPGVLRAVVGSGLYLTVLGLFALAIGGLIRHTAGAITAVIGMVLVIFPLAGLLPDSWGAHVHAYLPTVAGQLITADKTDIRAAAVAVAGLRRVLRLDRAAPGRSDRSCSSAATPKTGRGTAAGLLSRRRPGRAVVSGRRPGSARASPGACRRA